MSPIPLFDVDFRGERRRLQKAIHLTVATEGERFFVENDTLGLLAWGDTLDSAIAEFRRDLAYFLDYYLTLLPSEVTGDGQRLKGMYESLLA